MDPRTSAKVTAPDLLKAFREETGGVGEAVADVELRIWVAYGSDEVNYENFPLTNDGMTAALKLASGYLRDEGHTVILVVAKEQPESFQAAISASTG